MDKTDDLLDEQLLGMLRQNRKTDLDGMQLFRTPDGLYIATRRELRRARRRQGLLAAALMGVMLVRAVCDNALFLGTLAVIALVCAGIFR